MDLKVIDIERITLRVPFRDRVRPWNELLVGNWSMVEICKVLTSDPAIVGHGETVLHYTWRTVSDESVARVIGGNPADFLADDSLGAGLQMALHDVVGKLLGVPMHRLLSAPLVRDRCPISWWSTKMPADVLAEEARDAVAEGYLSHKFKARPWFDVRAQVAAIAAVTPSHYKVDIDWNEMLLSPGEAIPVLQELDAEERVGIYEDPIRRTDVAGQKFLRGRVAHPLTTHFEPRQFPTWIKEDALDGFVVDSGAVSSTLRDGQLCGAFEKNFWLQIAGTGLTTAYTAHLGSVLTHARWPAVTAMNIYADDLLREPLDIADGTIRVPTGPGLGISVDEDAIERYRVERSGVYVATRKLLTFSLPDGRSRQYAGIDHLWRDSWTDGTFPRQAPGAQLDVREDDGSDAFDKAYRSSELSANGIGDSIL